MVGVGDVCAEIRNYFVLPDGIHALYFTFEGEGAVSLRCFELHT